MLTISQEPSLCHRHDLPHWHVLWLEALASQSLFGGGYSCSLYQHRYCVGLALSDALGLVWRWGLL
jgi:hypothetical protein